MRNAAIARYLRRLLLALFLAWPALPVAAAGVGQDLLAPLAGDDTDARLRAIAALARCPAAMARLCCGPWAPTSSTRRRTAAC